MKRRQDRDRVTDVIGGTPPPCADLVLMGLADRLRRLAPSPRNPERFHEEKSEIVHALRMLAREVAHG